MSFWTPENIRSSCGGAWALRPAAADRPLNGLSTDTRTLTPGQAFLALRGERFDAHQHLGAALDAGALLLIVDDQAAAAGAEEHARRLGAGIVRVPETGKALLRLASAYRRTLENTRVVAVGGSNGKTTATRLIHAVLASSFRGTASIKSFNNSVGVPLTILSASPTDQFLICEVGTNAPGEIAQLASVIEPDVAVITSIGREHLEGFGSLQGVAREEASLLKFLRPGGLAVVTADTPVEAPLTEYLRGVGNVVRFGFAMDADLRASDAAHAMIRRANGETNLGVRFKINERTECTLRLLGEHNACNALAAFAVGRRFGIEPDRVIEALGEARGPEMRLEPVTIPIGTAGDPPIVVINDAYNANPDSMLAALHAFADVVESLTPARGVVVLGDMLELGEASEASHQEIGRRVRDLAGVGLVVLLGEQMDRWARPVLEQAGGPSVVSEPAADSAAIGRVAGMLRAGDAVLLKGSRRVGLERILAEVRRRHGQNPGGVSDKAPARSEAPCPT